MPREERVQFPAGVHQAILGHFREWRHPASRRMECSYPPKSSWSSHPLKEHENLSFVLYTASQHVRLRRRGSSSLSLGHLGVLSAGCFQSLPPGILAEYFGKAEYSRPGLDVVPLLLQGSSLLPDTAYKGARSRVCGESLCHWTVSKTPSLRASERFHAHHGTDVRCNLDGLPTVRRIGRGSPPALHFDQKPNFSGTSVGFKTGSCDI
ncbi:hypothetical protein BP00DRAFT_418301 [Aspergillus indologenus CBS 114.80]|uniref:Uncharacterized protein n=1 Tax=Aspergillus indologenus CBS 114.80 TaxID=1450541 RepID=A0A2V5IVQ4_9EURO|nr:hypothetical protein BP00DRAFT_418301 [Aspergillus indologenus CBS 114.80]